MSQLQNALVWFGTTTIGLMIGLMLVSAACWYVGHIIWFWVYLSELVVGVCSLFNKVNPFHALIRTGLASLWKQSWAKAHSTRDAHRRIAITFGLVYLIATALISVSVGAICSRHAQSASDLDIVNDSPASLDVPLNDGSPNGQRLTLEEEKQRQQWQAMALFESETGFTFEYVSQFFASPEDLAQLSTRNALRNAVQLDVGGEQELLRLLDMLSHRRALVGAAAGHQRQLSTEIQELKPKILDDIREGGRFADPELRDRWAALMADLEKEDLSAPEIETRAIHEALIFHKPIKTRDIINLIVLLRSMNKSIVDIERINKKTREFTTLIDSGYFAQSHEKSAAPGASIYVAPPSQRVAEQNEYRTRAIIEAIFASDGLGVRKALAEHEMAAQRLERFLGLKGQAPQGRDVALRASQPVASSGTSTEASDGRTFARVLDANAVRAMLPIRAPAADARTTGEDFKEAQERLRLLEEQHWIPTVQQAASNVLGADRAIIELRGLAGEWVFSEGKLYFGDRAYPVTITDSELIRLLSVPPPRENPFGFIGMETRVLQYPGVLPGNWVLGFEESGALGRPRIVGVEQLPRLWPQDSRDSEETMRSAGFLLVEPGPMEAGDYSRERRNTIIKRINKLGDENVEILKYWWQRGWGRTFKLHGFDGEWSFDQQGILVKPKRLVINDEWIVEAVRIQYGHSAAAPLPGLQGIWHLHDQKTLWQRP